MSLFKIYVIFIYSIIKNESGIVLSMKHCSFHEKHCFYVVKKSSDDEIDSLKKADTRCTSQYSKGYLLEAYDQNVHEGAKKFAESYARETNLFPLNTVFVHYEKLAVLKSSAVPVELPASMQLTENNEQNNFLYATVSDDKNSWTLKTADHEQLHSVVCWYHFKTKECTKRIPPIKLVFDDSPGPDVQTTPYDSSFEINETGESLNENNLTRATSLNFTDEQWDIFLEYMNITNDINTTAFKNNSKLQHILKEFLFQSNKSYIITEEHCREIGINISTFKKFNKLIDFIQPPYKIKFYTHRLVLRPSFLGDLLKRAAMKFLSFLKGIDVGLICRYLDLLNDPNKFTCDDAEEMKIPRIIFQIYKNVVYPILDSLLGFKSARNMIVNICYKIHAILTPLLRINWNKLFNKNLIQSFKNLDFQHIGDFIMENKDHLLRFSSGLMSKLPVPGKDLDKYKNALGDLTNAVKSKSMSLNNLVGNFKNGKVFNWRSLYDPGKSYLAKVKNFDFKKIGQIYSSLKDTLDGNLSLDVLKKFGLNILPNQFNSVKHIISGFGTRISEFNIKINDVIGKNYGNFSDKFGMLQSVAKKGLNVKKSALDVITGMVGLNEEEVDDDFLAPAGKPANAKAEKLASKYPNLLISGDTSANPFKISNDALSLIGVGRSDWNNVVQRVGDNQNPYPTEDPKKILFRGSVGDQCVVIYNAVTSWYEAQSMCANHNGHLVVFDKKLPFSVMNDKRIFAIPGFTSFWIGATRNVWTWINKGCAIIF